MAAGHSITPEVWKDTPRFPGYQVSDRGRVRSFWRRTWTRNGSVRTPSDEPRMIEWIKSPRGYWTVQLYDEGGKNRTCQVHRLVLEAFVGPCPDGHEGCHKDGDRQNPRLDNLYWGTRQQNCLDTLRHGRNKKAVLSPEQIDLAVSLHASGATHQSIADEVGVDRSWISRMLRRRGLRRSRHHFTEEEVAGVAAMRREGLSFERIAEAYGSSPKTVDGILRRRFGSSKVSAMPATINTPARLPA